MSKDRNTLDTLVLASCLGLALSGAACASGGATSRTQLSSAEVSTNYAEAAAESASSGASARSLDFAARAVAADPSNPWAHYDRGVALHDLGRTDAAIAAYRAAEQRFGNGGQWGKSIAIYGRARALDDVGRCAEARAAYSEYADFVRSFDPRAAEMATTYARQCREAQTAVGDMNSSVATSLIIGGNYAGALQAVDAATRANENAASPWLEYDRAIALAKLGRTDEAVQAFARVERQMAGSSASNSRWVHSIAIYGRAHALADARRCTEARKVYEEYAAFVRPTQPKDADMALAIAKNCIVP
jgi:tetratricopeptide (TPR) repeat protein